MTLSFHQQPGSDESGTDDVFYCLLSQGVSADLSEGDVHRQQMEFYYITWRKVQPRTRCGQQTFYSYPRFPGFPPLHCILLYVQELTQLNPLNLTALSER